MVDTYSLLKGWELMVILCIWPHVQYMSIFDCKSHPVWALKNPLGQTYSILVNIYVTSTLNKFSEFGADLIVGFTIKQSKKLASDIRFHFPWVPVFLWITAWEVKEIQNRQARFWQYNKRGMYHHWLINKSAWIEELILCLFFTINSWSEATYIQIALGCPLKRDLLRGCPEV